jgi:hypothetical protein
MLTPATITVNFLGNYAGPHRICWRVQGSGNNYVCTNIVDCVGGGNPCQAIINVMVESESCTPVIFEGYIQATCQPESSSTDQIPFTVTYTPTPSCNAYNVTNTTGDDYDFSSVELGLNCDGTERPSLLVASGDSFNLCGIAGMTKETIKDFDVVANPLICCSVCKNYTVNSTGVIPRLIYYIECSTKHLLSTLAPASGDPGVTICAVENSITSQGSVTIIDNGDC